MNTPAPAGVWIITPGHTPTRFPTAHATGADVALVDLEDSVPPAAKPDARLTARVFFTTPAPAGTVLGVRISSPTTRDGIYDLAALADYPIGPQIVLIPKVESPRDIEIVAGALDTPDHTPHLYALIETPRALEELTSIVRAERIAGVLFGTADYATATGCGRSWEPMLHARSTLVASAAAAGIPAIDSPFFDLDDLDGLRDEAERVKALGFTGKSCVHPRHLDVLTEVFRPSHEEIAAARVIVAAAENAGGRIVRVGHQMIGPPMVQAARSLLVHAAARTADEVTT
ncbi:Citrate lyase subunit beta-like protein (plasmid) [Streptomyces xanthophaeus]|uniref:HpcH/HpaI aldolase/citrate lyase family protein n=1 Tax=Streptomyces xanthophaeus TaxID=67385 RepID=UPI00233F5599|nr:aldolase/citrate lyase family protein [Streptomyces xanthophaeus]WCD91169.1 Citrate lyase subunit beta-like protein [Streptomyces xanthophaeus]